MVLGRDGFVLQWRTAGPYRGRRSCPSPDHHDCGLTWCRIPGVPGGKIELRPERPHREEGWRYDLFVPGRPMATGWAKDLVTAQHGMYHRVPDAGKHLPWVRAEVGVVWVEGAGYAWCARIECGVRSAEKSGGPVATLERAALEGARAVLAAMSKPAKVAILDRTGAVERLFLAGFCGKDEHGAIMAEIYELALEHVVRVVSEKRPGTDVSAGTRPTGSSRVPNLAAAPKPPPVLGQEG